MNLARVKELTQEVSNSLPGLDGWCAIGATWLAALLISEGFHAVLQVGTDEWEGHCWVRIGNVVADPTIGQYGLHDQWYVGPALPENHIEWDNIDSNPTFEGWPDEQQPQGNVGRRYLDREMLETVGLPVELS